MRLLLRRGTSGYVEADDALSITDSLACEAGLSPFLLPHHPSFSPALLEHVPHGGDTSGLAVPMDRFVARSRENAGKTMISPRARDP